MTVWLVLVSWGITLNCPPFEVNDPGITMTPPSVNDPMPTIQLPEIHDEMIIECEVPTTRTRIAQVVDLPTCQRLVLLLETNREYPHPDDHYQCEEE